MTARLPGTNNRNKGDLNDGTVHSRASKRRDNAAADLLREEVGDVRR